MMTIYSVGDVWYLGKVLDAIAMLTGADGGLRQASAIAALLGVIIICFQSVIKNQGINIQHMVVCYIIYMMCFGFTTNVAIESVYSDKQVIQKDNVPYGPAVMGYVVSQIGYKLTKKMEQAYQEIDDNQKMTNPTSGGYLNALYLIQNLGRISEDGTVGRAINAVDKDFQPNFLRYTSECTTKGMYFGTNKGGMDWGKLQSSGIWDAIKFTSNVFTTEFREHGNAQVYTCTEAHEKLKAEWNNAINSLQSGAAGDEAKNIGIRLGQCSTKGECSNTSDFLTSADASGIRAIFNGQTHAQDFVLAGYADNLIKHGLANGYAYLGDVNATAMMQQAINQRNVQWSAEQNMFLNSVRPMMAFVEGFFYAIAPFASIILMLGMMGLNIFFKYLILLVWVQLWLPVMSIANMFISVKANAFLSNLPLPTDGTTSTISLYVYETAIKGVQDYIAVGGMFMAATPLLTFVVISASAFAMTTLTGRMSGGDFVNEKMVSPDIASPAAALGMKSTFTGDPTTSAWRSGMERAIDFGSGLQATRSSLDATSKTLTSALQTSFTQGYSKLSEHGQSNATQQIKSESSQYMNSEAGSKAYNAAMGWLNSHGGTTGWSEQDKSDFATGVSAKLLGNGGSAEQSITKAYDHKVQKALSKIKNVQDAFNKSEQAAFAEAGANILSNALNNIDSSKEASSLSSQLSKQGSDVKSLSEQYSKLDSVSEFFKNSVATTNKKLIGQAMKRNENATGKLLDSLVNEGHLEEFVKAKEWFFADQGALGQELSKFEAIAQNNPTLAGKMYMGLYDILGYGGSLPNIEEISAKADRFRGNVSESDVGSKTVSFEEDNYNKNKERVEANTKAATIPNMKERQKEGTGELKTRGINKLADLEQKYNGDIIKARTEYISNSDLYREKGDFDWSRPGGMTRKAYDFAKKYIQDTGGLIHQGDFSGASKDAAKSFSSFYELNNSGTQQALADLIGGHSVVNYETSLLSSDRVNAKGILDKKAAQLEGLLAKDIAAGTKLTADEAKDKAHSLVTNLRFNLNNGYEQGIGEIVNEVKCLRDKF